MVGEKWVFLWKQQITAQEGMEYYLDSSEGLTFTPVAHNKPAPAPAAPEVKKQNAPEELNLLRLL